MDGTAKGIAQGVARLRWRRFMRRAFQLVPEVFAITACVGVIWAAVSLTLWQTRDSAIEAAKSQTATLARAFAESSERISTVLDRELLALRAGIVESGDAFDLVTWVRTRSSPDRMTLLLAFSDASGVITQSTFPAGLPPGASRPSLADRDHFQEHLDPDQDRLFISKPAIGRISGRCSVQYSRKIVDRAGSFAGVAVISVSCEDLSRHFETGDAGGAFIMLAGLDGVIRGFGPVRYDLVGTDLSTAPGFEPAMSETEGVLVAPAPWDRARRIVSFRRLDRYPLVVLVGYDDERTFRQYQPLHDRAIAIGAIATLIIGLFGGVWAQQRSRLAASRRALLLTLDNMSQGIVMIDAAGRIPVVNRRAIAMLDLPPAVLDPGREIVPADAGKMGLLTGDADNGQSMLHSNGRIIDTVSQVLPGGGMVRTFTDVTERCIAEARIRHMAHHDALTGVANRTLLIERIAELTRESGSRAFGLVWLGLDGFKTVNDALGHDAGDRLLREVSLRLRRLAGEGALLARTGGDEFALVCNERGQPETAESLSAAIVAALGETIEIGGTQFRLSASVGLAFHPKDGTTASDLLKHAVTAMYQAKALGRGHIVRFDPEMNRALRERGLIERDLRRALRDHDLEVWFQPRFETGPVRICGFEALARWRHPERGFVPPSLFIPIAEQFGLIAELGIQVLEDACGFAASLPDGRIAVNLSPVQFLSDDLPDLISEVLARNHLTPDRLELEVTEGVLIADETQALRTLKALHERRLHLALDDFGTGYASLSYLRRFPFDRIKIDRSFVGEQEHDNTTRAIVESMLTMARRLNLEVTAEGVENERQLDLLLSQGCPEVQGYFLGRPMPAQAAREFYEAQRIALKLSAA